MAAMKFPFLTLLLCLAMGRAMADNILVIGHPILAKLDAGTIQRLYTGPMVEVDNNPVTVINALSDNPTRIRFLAAFLGQGEEKYTACWTVRRFIG